MKIPEHLPLPPEDRTTESGCRGRTAPAPADEALPVAAGGLSGVPAPEVKGQGRTSEETQNQVREINDRLEKSSHALRFAVDEKDGEVFVKVVDRQSGETIKELPPRELRDMHARLEEMTGLLLEETI